jgi:hypothetical protein
MVRLILICLFLWGTHYAAAQGGTSTATTPSTVLPPRNECTADACIEIATQYIPYDIARDNYGRFVADRYLTFDVAVANNTQNTLYVNAFLFERAEAKTSPYLNTDAKLVRGSIEKGQLVGRRNVNIEILKTVGTVATGLSGFFKVAESAATAGRIIAAYNGPFITGISAIVPDTTVKYLNNWDQDLVFKNGFVVSKGQTERGRVFIPIETLFPEFRSKPEHQKAGATNHTKPKDFRIEEVRDRIAGVHVLGFSASDVNSLTNASSKSLTIR